MMRRRPVKLMDTYHVSIVSARRETYEGTTRRGNRLREPSKSDDTDGGDCLVKRNLIGIFFISFSFPSKMLRMIFREKRRGKCHTYRKER